MTTTMTMTMNMLTTATISRTTGPIQGHQNKTKDILIVMLISFTALPQQRSREAGMDWERGREV